MRNEIGLYVHIPFCVSKCYYCDFLSFPAHTLPVDIFTGYAQALIDEINEAGKDVLYKEGIDTIYMGGGTPNALPARLLQDILLEIFKLNIASDAEITIELNPAAETGDLLYMLRHMRVNRLSIGLQAWQDRLLEKIGRAHTCDEFIATYESARNAGFDNINIDIIFGLPGQSMFDLRETLKNIVSLKPEHISAYSLTLEEGSRLSPVPDEIDRDMYWFCNEFLQNAGYTHYEISNYAMPGYEGHHNTRYWRRRPYIGFGLGASSFINNTRWENTESLNDYINGKIILGKRNIAKVTNKEAMSEYAILGLRMMEGITGTDFLKEFGTPIHHVYGDEIMKLINNGLIIYENDVLCLTKKGMDLANKVFVCFI